MWLSLSNWSSTSIDIPSLSLLMLDNCTSCDLYLVRDRDGIGRVVDVLCICKDNMLLLHLSNSSFGLFPDELVLVLKIMKLNPRQQFAWSYLFLLKQLHNRFIDSWIHCVCCSCAWRFAANRLSDSNFQTLHTLTVTCNYIYKQ